MAIKSSGSLSFNSDIVGEFGGSTPHSLSEYKRGGSFVPNGPSANASIPTSNSNIQFSDFYGAVNEVILTSAGNVNGQAQRKQIKVSSFIASGGILRIPSNIWVWSDSTSVAALTIDIPCTIINEGKIIGKGGRGGNATNGNGLAGGPAIKVNSGVSSVFVTNASGAYIAGGGGGGASRGYSSGGGGAGGGAGGTSSGWGSGNGYTGGAGGALNATGADGGAFTTGNKGKGGGAGGGGGAGTDFGSSRGYGGAGGGGGRILLGVGGAGGDPTNTNFGGTGPTDGHGGSAGNVGYNGSGAYGGEDVSGGGGGWGAKGGNGATGVGGAGGAAISGSASLTNNGTIYGST